MREGEAMGGEADEPIGAATGEAIGEAKVVVVGNATVDETWRVASLPLSGQSLVGDPLPPDLGGKSANVAVVVARCDVRTRLVSVVGDDARGGWIAGRLRDERVDATLLVADAAPTDVSIVYVAANGDNAIVSSVRSARRLEAARAVAGLDALARGGTVVLHGNLSRETTLAVARAAAERGVTVALNASPLTDWTGELLPFVDVLFVNAGEAEALSGATGEAAARALRRCGPRRVVVTRGADDALLCAADEAGRTTVARVPSVPADAVDTTGAGDTFLGVALASALRRGVALDARALRDAARAAAMTVARAGTVASFPSPAELDAILRAP